MALTCTRADYVSDGKCFTQKNFSQHEQNAILVYRMAQWVDAQIGTPTYSVSPYTALNTESTTELNGLTNDQLEAAYFSLWNVNIDANFAPAQFANGSAVVPLTAATAATAIACLKNYKPSQLKRMKVFLQCNIFALLGL